MDLIFNLAIKIIPYILIGLIFARYASEKTELIVKYFINFSIYLLIPIFMFFTMWETPIKENINNSKNIVIIVVLVVFFGMIFAKIFSKIFHLEFKNVALPITFMNSGYLAIPLNTIFLGMGSTFHSIIYNITLDILFCSAGLWIVSGSIIEIFRLPVLYAAFCGIFLSLKDINIPNGLFQFSKILNTVTIPVMLCLVGYQIKPISFNMFKKVIIGVVIRMIGGLAVAYIFCGIFKITGVVKGVCLLSSSMPSAVTAYIFAKKYDADSLFASSMIVVGLVMSIVLIPVVLWLI
ncbi:MAG: AEC family transporter [Elusimicrobia bacterium]|nr:AEC family transporter [Elusimicrobiota bacterium]